MRIRSIRLHAPQLAFAAGTVAVYAAALAIVSRLGRLERPEIVASAVTVDLTLLVPLLYYLLLVRWRGWPVAGVLPVFLVSVALAGRVLPRDQHHALAWAYYGAGLAEVVLVGIVLVKLRDLGRGYRERTSAGLDVCAALRDSAQSLVGRVPGAVVAYEIAVLHYAVFGWRRSPAEEPGSFTYHRSSGYPAVAAAVAIIVVVETAAVHLLVRSWSPVAAWILSGLSVYALVWLAGDAQAVRLRPIRVSASTLHLRTGLRWTIDVPLDSIGRVVVPDVEAPPGGRAGYLKAVPLGAPNRRIELAFPVEALGPYGLSRRVGTIDVHVDEPDRFDATLDRMRHAWHRRPGPMNGPG